MTNTGPERFAIVEIPEGKPPANAILIGPMDMLMEQLPDTRARSDAMRRLDEAQLNAEEIAKVQDVTRALQVAAFCDSIQHISRRLDAYTTRRDARIRAEEEAREVEEQQRKADRIKQALDALEETSGELTTHPPTEPQHEEELSATEHPPTEDDQGDLPRELEVGAPPDPGTEPELSGSREPEAKNPVGISW
jgi:hypothetical protein